MHAQDQAPLDPVGPAAASGVTDRARSRRVRPMVVAAVVVGMLAAGVGYWALRVTTAGAVEDRFTALATDVATEVDGRLAATESAVLAAQGLFDTGEQVSSLDFFRFTDALARGRPLAERFPGLTALAAVDVDQRVIVTAPSHPAIRTTVREVLRRGHLDQLLASATEGAVPVTGEVVSEATAADLAVATARYDNPIADQLQVAPEERRESVTGWSVALLEADRLLDGVLPSGVPGMGVRLLDETGRQLGTAGSVAPAAVEQQTVSLEHADGTFRLEVVTTSNLASPAERRLPGLVALMGILLTAAGAGVLWLLSTQRERALAQVEAATAEVVRTNTELADANERLREFAGVVAHDLRGPLTGVHGMVTMLRRRVGDDLSPTDADLLAGAERSAARMDVLIADILRYAEAGVAPTDMATMPLDEVTRDVLEGLDADRRQGDTIEVDAGGCRVVADPTGLRRVLGNLIGNALKYRDGADAVHVEVRAHRRDGRVVVEVADDGPGIPAEQREDLVTPFHRGDTTVEGTGLGLAICTRIIAHHGGTLELGDSQLGGALARFDLPAA